MAARKKRISADAQIAALAKGKKRGGCRPRTSESCGSGLCAGKPNFVKAYPYKDGRRGPYCRGSRGKTTPKVRGTKKAESGFFGAASAYGAEQAAPEKSIRARTAAAKKRLLASQPPRRSMRRSA
jgi:hypothetical protein